MDYRLLRIILIDSYCHNRIAEVDVSGHITLNGANGAGKTTLLRLLPMFFGESPSRIIRGDAVTERFGRYYFPTTGSYVIFEYQRRNQKALAVMHPDGLNSDGVVYRFIDREYSPELFMDGNQVVQSRDLYRHLDKQGVFDSKPLTLHSYRQIIQNTAGREHRNLAARFSLIGGTGKLTHIERVVTGILQRATTFNDLKKMVVSSVLNNDETFSLRTGKKDLLHWVNEYEAHRDLMDKAPLMNDLEQADQTRRIAEADFAKLHARMRLVKTHLQEQVEAAEKAESDAKQALADSDEDYRQRLQVISDKRVEAESRMRAGLQILENLDLRMKKYQEENIDSKVDKVNSIDKWQTEREPLAKQLHDLESEVKSVVEIFNAMEQDAKNAAREQKSKLDGMRADIHEAASTQSTKLAESLQINIKSLKSRHDPELDALQSKQTALRVREAGLKVELSNAKPSEETERALNDAREQQSNANKALTDVHEKSGPLQTTLNKIKSQFVDLEEQINGGESAIEDAQESLDEWLAADSAGEETLLGFLRKHKPNWTSNIGRIVAPETLLRSDLSPQLSEGDDLFGITIDVDKIKAGRFTSEESIQQEIKLLRTRLEKRTNEVAEDRKALVKCKAELEKAKEAVRLNDAEKVGAKNKQETADAMVISAAKRATESKIKAMGIAEIDLQACQRSILDFDKELVLCKKAHSAEIEQAERSYKDLLDEVKADVKKKLDKLEADKRLVDSDLQAKINAIGIDRDASLQSKGVSPDALNGIRRRIQSLDDNIEEAINLKSHIGQYQDWLENSWSQKVTKTDEWNAAKTDFGRHDKDYGDMVKERQASTLAKQAVIAKANKLYVELSRLMTFTDSKLPELALWPQDPEVLATEHGSAHDVDVLDAERRRLKDVLEKQKEIIRLGVDAFRRQMCSSEGTGPEKFHAAALIDLGFPRAGKEYEWLDVLRNWFNNEHITNRTSLLQLGKTMAQNISFFWKSLDDFKRSVSTFATDLRSNLEDGRIFDAIADVNVEIKAHVDTQNYWEAVGNLHKEYEAWHTHGDPSLPPLSFVAAAKEVANVVADDKGLVADPVDLISLKISANVNNQGVRTANNETELTNMSSNGLSYIILCVILIGFVNRIRRSEPVVIPFVVDELKDLSFSNAKTLLELLSRNNITMISAFPDVDLDFAELFDLNYKILAGRKVGLIDFNDDNGSTTEAQYV